MRIPAGVTEAFEGFEITISIAARQPDTNAAAEFAVAYSTDGAGNSGWQHFTPDSTWSVFEFSYTVPEGASGSRDILRIWADTSGSGLGVIIDGVRVKRVAGEVQEITAALEQEQQARIDGDDALASDLSALTTRVGDNESGLTAEQQARADADSAWLRTSRTWAREWVMSNLASLPSNRSGQMPIALWPAGPVRWSPAPMMSRLG